MKIDLIDGLRDLASGVPKVSVNNPARLDPKDADLITLTAQDARQAEDAPAGSISTRNDRRMRGKKKRKR